MEYLICRGGLRYIIFIHIFTLHTFSLFIIIIINVVVLAVVVFLFYHYYLVITIHHFCSGVSKQKYFSHDFTHPSCCCRILSEPNTVMKLKGLFLLFYRIYNKYSGTFCQGD